MPFDPDFRPLPLLGNPHVQTVLGSFWTGRPPALKAVERLVELPDGDRLVLHDTIPAGWRDDGRTVLLVHGLGGSHNSPYLRRLGSLLLPHGLRLVRMDLRGSGSGIALARLFYHGGLSDDVRAAAAELHRLSPASPLTLAGISLGGNLVLKLAGEAADRPVPGLERVAALAPPIDLVRCAALLALPRNRLYNRHFVRQLTRQALRRQWLIPDLPPVRFPRHLTMRQFDEMFTAPHWGFDDALDYYRQASSVSLLERIAVPTFVLTARDDPFIAVEPFEELRWPGHVSVHIADRGGHLGFLGWDGAGGVRWAERRLAEWLLRREP